MSTRTSIMVMSILILIGLLASAFFYPYLPDPVASHWAANDQVNGYMPRFWGIALMPLVTLIMMLFFLVIPEIDPLKENIAKFREPFNIFIVLTIAFMLYIHGLTLAWNLGFTFAMSTALIPALGLLFIFAGVLMAKAKRNYFIGIRTPWTLASDTVWNKTHKLGSKLFIAAGILSVLTILVGPSGFWLMFFLIMAAALIPVVYSYILWRDESHA